MKLAGTEESLEPGYVVSKSSVQTKVIKERGGKSSKIAQNQVFQDINPHLWTTTV